MTALWMHRGLYKGGSNFFLGGRGGGQLLKRGSNEGRLNSYSLLYYTHLLISLSGNSTVELLLSVKHSTLTLNKIYPILYIRGSVAMPPGEIFEILIATGAF